MNPSIKPIQTAYKGYLFRSRLEARWAVFFDAAGIEWEYEKEGFDLGEAGRYLPDFYLPGLSTPTWLEIKPNKEIDLKDLAKVEALNAQLSFRPSEEGIEDARILCGNPWPGKYGSYFIKNGKLNWRYIWARCPLCGRIDLMSIDADNDETDSCLCMWCDVVDRNDGENEYAEFHKGTVFSKGGYPITKHPQLMSAFIAARSARFEHGESP